MSNITNVMFYNIITLPSISKNYLSLSPSYMLMSAANSNNNIDFFHATLLDLNKLF
jgi:hypothetical protein